MVVQAASPLAKVTQYLAPSSEARHDSSTSRVGFPLREYSYLHVRTNNSIHVPDPEHSECSDSRFTGMYFDPNLGLQIFLK
jgi:hypothetical protein